MSDYRSYFSRNNTIIYNSSTNTGMNPVTELFFGSRTPSTTKKNFSRFIFDIDLSGLIEKVNDGYINFDCNREVTHELRMVNSSAFDEELLNDITSDGKRRATSFDLILFRIPLTSGSTGDSQTWDEGVGYDFIESNTSVMDTMYYYNSVDTDKSFSDRPSNYVYRSTIDQWSEPGIYNNENAGSLNYRDLHIVDTQHFEKGNEDIAFDMTDEINGVLQGSITGVTGYGIAFKPQVENLTGLTESYSVGFFTRHTQTFYEPHLYTQYDDIIEDKRYNFTENTYNKLYLYFSRKGSPLNLDQNPTVTILDTQGNAVPELVDVDTCRVSKGIYEIELPQFSGGVIDCVYSDVWKNLIYDGNALCDITNEFTLKSFCDDFSYDTSLPDLNEYGFNFWGLKRGEKILNTDQRKVTVIPKKAFTKNELINDIDVEYRIYVKEGTTSVQVTDWTRLSQTPQEYFFLLDLRDKIPNEYFIDLRLLENNSIRTYENEINFIVTNKK